MLGVGILAIRDGAAVRRKISGDRNRFSANAESGFVQSQGEWQGYINLKGYAEFASQNRPDGRNAWLTFATTPAARGEAPQSATRHMITK